MTLRIAEGARARRLAIGIAAALSVACFTTPTPEPPIQYQDYQVGAPDELAITILPEPVIQEVVVVRPDGRVTIQLLGDVEAGGRTTQMIADDIEKRIARYKRGAVVTVALARAQSSAVTVIGEVNGPRSFALVKAMRVAEALGQVEDVTWLANEDEIRVVRPGTPPQVIEVDLAAIRGGDLSTNVQLYGGDIIYVPPTILARIGYAIRAVLFPFQPLLGLAYSAGGNAIVP
jgi:polysaccharide export outer membrane protein